MAFILFLIVLNVLKNKIYRWRRKRHTKMESAGMSSYEKILLAVGNDVSWVTSSTNFRNNVYTPSHSEYLSTTVLLSNSAELLLLRSTINAFFFLNSGRV